MKTKILLGCLALLIAITGVSCGSEMMVSECNLRTGVSGLEDNGVTYQYSVEKNSGPKGGMVCTWQNFDASSGNVSVENLVQGSYTFRVRVVSDKTSQTMYSGSKEAFITAGSDNEVEIVLYPVIDRNIESALSIHFPVPDVSKFTADVVYKNCDTSDLEIKHLSKTDTGFSDTFTLSPGNYQVQIYVYQEGVEVGGCCECIFVPTGYEKTYSPNIEVDVLENIKNIATTEEITLSKTQPTTLAWVGEVDSNGSGYWRIGSKVVEKNAMFYVVSGTETEPFDVVYYRGHNTYTCHVKVGGKNKYNIMNFRSANDDNACIGYVSKTTGDPFPLTTVELSSSAGISDYEALGYEPVFGQLLGAEFGEINSIDKLISSQYGSNSRTDNTTLKYLVVRGSVTDNKFRKRFKVIEKVLVDQPAIITSNAFDSLTTLQTIYIIPREGKWAIESSAFTGCSSLSKIYIQSSTDLIESELLVLGSTWNSGTNLTRSDIVFTSELPL